MRWPQFGAYDFFIILAYCILNFYLFNNWYAFNCQEPLNLWLAVDYTLLLVIRIIVVLKHSGYSEMTIKVCNILFYAVIFPIIVTWSIIGIIWYQGGLSCIPDDLVPWSYLLWLAITVTVALITIGTLIYDYHQHRKLKKFIQRSDEKNKPFLQESFQRNGKEVEIKIVPYSS